MFLVSNHGGQQFSRYFCPSPLYFKPRGLELQRYKLSNDNVFCDVINSNRASHHVLLKLEIRRKRKMDSLPS